MRRPTAALALVILALLLAAACTRPGANGSGATSGRPTRATLQDLLLLPDELGAGYKLLTAGGQRTAAFAVATAAEQPLVAQRVGWFPSSAEAVAAHRAAGHTLASDPAVEERTGVDAQAALARSSAPALPGRR